MSYLTSLAKKRGILARRGRTSGARVHQPAPAAAHPRGCITTADWTRRCAPHRRDLGVLAQRPIPTRPESSCTLSRTHVSSVRRLSTDEMRPAVQASRKWASFGTLHHCTSRRRPGTRRGRVDRKIRCSLILPSTTWTCGLATMERSSSRSASRLSRHLAGGG